MRRDMSENGKGVWVVKSRTLSTTTSQTTPTIPVITILPLENKQESYQTLKSNNDIICVEDKSAQSGDPCSVSSVCLQQEQGQLSSNYLQCDQR
ncbi:unnamed protein product [Brugia timori]|uniref:Uncharacterized protein n=1 Tax=Brugia timori TaxID=42155 RepID=A0A0R3R343_9BILA|nr:unnamed protein product [Brugia timori]